MKTLVLLLIALLAGCSSSPPDPQGTALSVTLGDSRQIVAPEGSATGGSKWIQFDASYQNTSGRSVWVYGYSPEVYGKAALNVFCQLETRSDENRKWALYGPWYCGTGAGSYEVKAGVNHNFQVELPEKYRGEQFRVGVCYLDSPEAKVWKKAVSSARQVVETQQVSK
jgi:hypothetical protein